MESDHRQVLANILPKPIRKRKNSGLINDVWIAKKLGKLFSNDGTQWTSRLIQILWSIYRISRSFESMEERK